MAKILGLSLRPLRKEIKVSDREVMVNQVKRCIGKIKIMF